MNYDFGRSGWFSAPAHAEFLGSFCPGFGHAQALFFLPSQGRYRILPEKPEATGPVEKWLAGCCVSADRFGESESVEL